MRDAIGSKLGWQPRTPRGGRVDRGHRRLGTYGCWNRLPPVEFIVTAVHRRGRHGNVIWNLVRVRESGNDGQRARTPNPRGNGCRLAPPRRDRQRGRRFTRPRDQRHGRIAKARLDRNHGQAEPRQHASPPPAARRLTARDVAEQAGNKLSLVGEYHRRWRTDDAAATVRTSSRANSGGKRLSYRRFPLRPRTPATKSPGQRIAHATHHEHRRGRKTGRHQIGGLQLPRGSQAKRRRVGLGGSQAKGGDSNAVHGLT